jgi:hypothetical protein
MADETTTATGGTEQEAGSAAADTTGVESRTFTQADLDRIVTERLAKEKQRGEAAAQKARADAERKAAEEQGEWKKLADQYKAEAETERQRAHAATLAVQRRDIAARLNIPSILADRLVGETVEEMEADAKTLLAGLPKTSVPTANAGNGAKQPGAATGKSMDAFIRAASGRGL